MHSLMCHFRVMPFARSAGSDTWTLYVCLMSRSDSLMLRERGDGYMLYDKTESIWAYAATITGDSLGTPEESREFFGRVK